MDKNKEFIREHGETIKVTLRNIKLSEDVLKNRIEFIRKILKSSDDKKMFDDFVERIEDVIRTTEKDKFSEEEISAMMYKALNVDLREYDKSHLVDLDKNEITSLNAIPFKKMKPYTYGDTTITPLGIVTHKEWTGLEDWGGLTYYQINRRDSHGKEHVHKVFSHIDIGKMETDLDYRRAVIYELLDENNMTKTNCGGYIGSIQTATEGQSLEDTVKVNEKYSLVFDSTDATVIAKLREQAEKQRERKNRDKNGEER